MDAQKRYVKYSDFGAVGNGIADDSVAIFKTHEYANENGYTVIADEGSVYYMGPDSYGVVVPIQTNVDWTGAVFIVDDTKLPPHTGKRLYPIFEVKSSDAGKMYKIPAEELAGKSIKQWTDNIGFKFECDCMVVPFNSNEQIFIRHGLNKGTSNKHEAIIVDKDGNVDASTPVMWEYSVLTELQVRPLSEEPVTLKGGTFISWACQVYSFNEEEKAAGWLTGNQYYYYHRGINVTRCNTTVSGVTHIIQKEGDEGYPYAGWFSTNSCCNVLYENCRMTGHKKYHENRPDGNGTDMGSYDINLGNSVNVTWRGCTQLNDITDTEYWGVMCSNFSRNLTYDGCTLSRFDAHEGAWGAKVISSTLGHSFSVVGGGTVLVENTEKVGGNTFLALRPDYGSTWCGDVIIRNCSLVGNEGAEHVNLIWGAWKNWDFGYPCYLPKNIEVDNFYYDADSIVVFDYPDLTEASFAKADNKNPLICTESISIKNQKKPIRLALEGNCLYSFVKDGSLKVEGELN